MPRAYLCLALSPAAPALTRAGIPGRLTPFGQWLRGRLTLNSRRWAAVEFERLQFSSSEIRLVLGLRHFTLPLVPTVAVAHALMCETEAAARRAGWLPEGAVMWSAGETRVWCSEHFRPNQAVAGSIPGRDGGVRRPAHRASRGSLGTRR